MVSRWNSLIQSMHWLAVRVSKATANFSSVYYAYPILAIAQVAKGGIYRHYTKIYIIHRDNGKHVRVRTSADGSGFTIPHTVNSGDQRYSSLLYPARNEWEAEL